MASDKKTRRTFDFEPYPDELEYLDSQDNKTKYLVNLIRKDMQEKSYPIDKEAIFEIIEEYLQGKNLIAVIADSSSENNEIDEQLRNSALKILGEETE